MYASDNFEIIQKKLYDELCWSKVKTIHGRNSMCNV